MVEFVLQDVFVAAVSQVLITCQGKGIRVSCNLPERYMKQTVYGDGVRLQQILSDFLFVSVKFSPVGGSVEISCSLTKNSIGENLHLIDLELRYVSHDICTLTLLSVKTVLKYKMMCINSCGSMFFRIKHQGKGVPADLLSQMYEDDNKEQSDEGMSLAVSRNLLRLMNGDVRHMREAGMSTFILSVELASAPAK